MIQYSGYQNGIFEFGENGRGHGVVEAAAGSGKTSTLVELARRLTAKHPSANIIFLAFNKHIADELGTRLAGTNASARTIHSVGNSAVTGSVGRTTIDARKYNTLAQEWVDRNILRFPEDERKDAAAEVPGVLAKLVNFARLTLVDAKDAAALDAMCLHFDIEVAYPSLLFGALPTILEQGKEAARNKKIIDFTDMIWLPVALNLNLQKFDFILCDESQDLSACQLELVMKMCKPDSRVVFVGDRNQSILGFAGADNLSVNKIISRTNATTLPLSISYRCPASHIRLAQMVVPSIEARPNAPEGEIVFAKNEDDLQKMVQASDLIICRLTAPLIKECIKLIKNKVSARVRGRDIGKDLVSLLKKVAKMEGFSYDKVVAFLESYRALQEDFLRQKKADESMIESLNDRVSCLQVCAESFLDAKSIGQLSAEIEALFDDNRPAVWLSTIHRAKGLEADRVFILKPEKLPLRWKNQQDWQFSQELNLLYVALTRAKKVLVFLGDLPDPCQQEKEVQPEREALEAAQDAFSLEAETEAERVVRHKAIASAANDARSPWGEFMSKATMHELSEPPVTAQEAQRLDMTRLAEAIAVLDALVHDKCAMYKTDKVREAAEEVKRQFELMQQREVIELSKTEEGKAPANGSTLVAGRDFPIQNLARMLPACPKCGGALGIDEWGMKTYYGDAANWPKVAIKDFTVQCTNEECGAAGFLDVLTVRAHIEKEKHNG